MQAEDAVFPALIPGPKVPIPIQNAADNNAIDFNTVVVVAAMISMLTRNANNIGVSIIAALIRVNVNIFPYAFLLMPIDSQAVFPNSPNPIAGPMLPKPIAIPLAISFKVSASGVVPTPRFFINIAIMKLNMTGVCIIDCDISMNRNNLFPKNGCLASAKQAAFAGIAETKPIAKPDIPTAAAMPSSDIAV